MSVRRAGDPFSPQDGQEIGEFGIVGRLCQPHLAKPERGLYVTKGVQQVKRPPRDRREFGFGHERGAPAGCQGGGEGRCVQRAGDEVRHQPHLRQLQRERLVVWFQVEGGAKGASGTREVAAMGKRLAIAGVDRCVVGPDFQHFAQQFHGAAEAFGVEIHQP